MIALDTTFLLDYLDGVEATAEFLAEYEEEAFVAPALALFEVYRGAARAGNREQVDRVRSSLDWVEPLPVDDAAAREAALVEAELLADGQPINLGDVLLAGVCRNHGTPIVTRDDDFERVPDLDVLTY